MKRLNGEILKALPDAGFKSRLEEQGAEPRSSTPEEYNWYLMNELERWTKVIETAGIKVE